MVILSSSLASGKAEIASSSAGRQRPAAPSAERWGQLRLIPSSFLDQKAAKAEIEVRLMKALVTGSAGHLGEGLVRTLNELNYEVVGLDVLKSPFTTHIGSIADRAFLRRCLHGVRAVFHTATLHKPHVVTHTRQEFVDTNMTGTLSLLEEAVAADVESFVFTSTTSVFGDALVPLAGASAVWVTEDLSSVPKNIYGVTKAAAEDLCQLFHRDHKLACIVLRTSRFFLEPDDDSAMREGYADQNLKANEYLFRRVDLEDAVNAHVLAAERAPKLGFGRYIISATTPFSTDDLPELREDAPEWYGGMFPSTKPNTSAATGKCFRESAGCMSMKELGGT
jgi:UDP-glucose 4-epimerase